MNQVPDIFTPDGFVTGQMIQRAVSRGGDDVDRMISALEGLAAVPGAEGHAADPPVRPRDAPADVPGADAPGERRRRGTLKTFPAGNMAPTEAVPVAGG